MIGNKSGLILPVFISCNTLDFTVWNRWQYATLSLRLNSGSSSAKILQLVTVHIALFAGEHNGFVIGKNRRLGLTYFT